MSDILIVTWLGGGATHPAIGLGRELSSRGHDLRILAPAQHRERVAAAGCEHVAQPPAAEFDTRRGRAMEDQMEFLESMFFGSLLADALAAEVARRRPDAVVVDFLLRSVMSEAEALDLTRVALVHLRHQTIRAHTGDPDEPWGSRWLLRRANDHRITRGLPPLPPSREPTSFALARRAHRALVVLPRAFDDWPDPPANVVHVGPIDEQSTPAPWTPPWPADDQRPLIVVTLGTTYMHQEDLLRRVLTALHSLDARVLVLTGHELGPSEVPVGHDVHVQSYVPHAAVFPHAALIISHAGVGSLLEAFRAGVPSVCIPLGRDQPANAAAAAARNAAIALPSDTPSDHIRAAAIEALNSHALHRGASHLAHALASCGGATRAATEIEHVTRPRVLT